MRDWRVVAEEASKERDKAKLARLVAELCEALDRKAEFSTQLSTTFSLTNRNV